MPKEAAALFHHCLYFTATSLARSITRMAEEEFRITGVSPSHAFLVMLVNSAPGISPKELAHRLQLAPSTITRFVDTLVHKGYLERRSSGKNSELYPTPAGEDLQPTIELAWHNLFERYSQLLGVEASRQLTQSIDEAAGKLEK